MVPTTSIGTEQLARPDTTSGAGGHRPPVGWIAAAIYLTMLAAWLLVARHRDGDFTYPLDDSYIHLRLGANLAHGTLGMNPGQFASASSSPIWPVLIAGATLVTRAPLVGIPLALAALASVVTLVLLDRWARARDYSQIERVLLMAGMVLVVPLLSVTLTGMEHALQIGGGLLLVALVVQRVELPDGDQGPVGDAGAGDDHRGRRGDLAVLGAAALCAATRLEAVFLLVPLAVLVATHRRWRTLGALVVGGVAPVLVVAAINLGQGWPALPASVLIKAGSAHRSLGPAVLVLIQTRLLLVMTLAVVLCWWGRHTYGSNWPRTATWWAAIAVSASLLNVAAGLNVQLYRYEAYLVAVCVVACSVNAHALRIAARERPREEPAPLVLRGLVATLAAGAVLFGLATVPRLSNGMQEIHLQQVQMARFAASACNGCTVVVNDIGKVSLDGGVEIVDSVGLADLEVLEAKREGRYDRARLDEIATNAGASLAMIYPGWTPGPPARWERIGSWSLPDAKVVGSGEVVFFSLDPSRTLELQQALREFQVPPEVTVTITP